MALQIEEIDDQNLYRSTAVEQFAGTAKMRVVHIERSHSNLKANDCFYNLANGSIEICFTNLFGRTAVTQLAVLQI